MESTRPIRALTRGLDALTVLNYRDGATVSEVAQDVRLPRTTVYRILETLCDAGFVFRDTIDDRYRLTIRVRGLSDAFADEDWVTGISGPLLAALGRAIVWPVSMATLSGISMMVRDTTDHATPLALERYGAGFHESLPDTATGRAYLAFCPAAERGRLLDELALAPAPLQELQLALERIRTEGYATAKRTRQRVEEEIIGVPVMVGERVLAVLSVRYAAASLEPRTAGERFVPLLRQCAAQIGALSERAAVA